MNNKTGTKTKNLKDLINPLAIISKDRERTNLLRKYEQAFIAYLVQRIPNAINSDMLTALGFMGSILVFASLVISTYFGPLYLLLGVAGFFINWFGDSLDGRIAYYRNKPRKWYGFALDITADWIGIVLIGFGFVIYIDNPWEMLGMGFVVLYGWEIISALLRYKITGKYTIDSGIFGPTEVRIVLSLVLVLEAFVPGSIVYPAVMACSIIFILNLVDTVNLLKAADMKDKEDKKAAQNA
ncbi:MAG TPA: CDP-alcohol phosphatidyltransferase family protein [Paludibacter sp.]|nr:CDP-alcohol phosphatidyltransferase family protein [Paludibacter sp.]